MFAYCQFMEAMTDLLSLGLPSIIIVIPCLIIYLRWVMRSWSWVMNIIKIIIIIFPQPHEVHQPQTHRQWNHRHQQGKGKIYVCGYSYSFVLRNTTTIDHNFNITLRSSSAGKKNILSTFLRFGGRGRTWWLLENPWPSSWSWVNVDIDNILEYWHVFRTHV